MLDRWYRRVRIKMTFRRFRTLPRHPAYNYEYLGTHALLTPRPRLYQAILPLEPKPVPERIDAQRPVRIRPLDAADWERFPARFADAFSDVPPFSALPERLALRAAGECLQRTRDGGDGPLIEPACFVAHEEDDAESPIGAILVTLMPEDYLEESSPGYWREPPPPDWLERRIGRPHLTWIFVNRPHGRYGVGSGLLAPAGNALLTLGYTELTSTFLLGNSASTLWHWRNGFRLLGCPGSDRAGQRRGWRKGPARGGGLREHGPQAPWSRR
jgi:hypothetical protein